jgi:hypothetical protein
MDRRTVRLALGLTIAGASLLIAGVASWLITAVGRATSGSVTQDLRLAGLALLAGGAVCGLSMGLALALGGRVHAAGPPDLPGEARPIAGAPPASMAAPSTVSFSTVSFSTVSREGPGDQPSGGRWPEGTPSADPAASGRVWWRAAHSPASGWDDTSEEWLRSLRGPGIQQPPPHSAE